MAKIIDKYTIEIEQQDLGKRIDLRELAQTKLETNTVKEIIEKEIESKLSSEKEALEDRIRKQIKAEYNTHLDEAKKVAKLEGEKNANDEIRRLEKLISDAKTNAKLAEEKLSNEKENFDKVLDAKIKEVEAVVKSKMENEIQKAKEEAAKRVAEAAEAKAKLEGEIKVNNERIAALKDRVKIEVREELELQYTGQIKKLEEEKTILANQKRNSNQKQYGNEFEDLVQAELQNAFDRTQVQKIVAGEDGADFIASVNKDGVSIGKILIECKNPQSNKIDKKWFDKLIKDGAKHESKYKLLVTQASENGADDKLPYWRQDEIHNIYVVRLEFVKLFVELLTHLMLKEHAIEGIKDAEEAMTRITKMLNFKDTVLPKLQKTMKERAADIETKCNTIDNATKSIRDEARKMSENDINAIIKGINEI